MGKTLESILVKSQNAENEEVILSIENNISEKVEKLCKEQTHTQFDINLSSVLQSIAFHFSYFIFTSYHRIRNSPCRNR